ncbi:Uncharacterised protein [Mycobacteroides abscessus subsp. abscessus]|nr:Uncharacterised protein [Mycobacteroides abscessus subsp. abscessus]
MLDVLEFAESRICQCFNIDRRIRTDSGNRPRRLQELPAGAFQVRRARPNLLGVTHQNWRMVWQMVDQHGELTRMQHGQKRFHPVDTDSVGQFGEHLPHPGAEPVSLLAAGNSGGGGQLGSPGPHLVGEEQFATGHSEHGGDLQLRDRTLVGDGEVAHLADLVAPELDAHRMVGSGTEHVENAAAHRELTAAGHHVHPRVRELDQTRDHPVELQLGPDGQLHRFQIEQLGRHRL